MRESAYIKLISGQNKGWFARLLRCALSSLVPVYGLVICLRNLLYDRRLKPVQQLSVPVISVGNITTGGTGKTPTVAWLVKWLQSHGLQPAILSRGYQDLDGQGNDEKRLLDQLCPGVPHLQNRDRVAGGQALLKTTNSNVIVLDDGFQHRRLSRDIDLVLIDALNPWGYGHLLPRGLLREPLSGLRRAHVILLTRCDQVPSERVQAIMSHLAKLGDCKISTSRFTPTGLVNASGMHISFESVNGKRTCSFAGIGNPDGFRRTLAGVGLVVSDQRFQVFPDHHHYTPPNFAALEHWAREQNAECLITTRKDLVKINVDKIGCIPLWAVDIELEFLDAEAHVAEALSALFAAALKSS